MNITALQQWLIAFRPALVTAIVDGVRAHVEALRSRGVEYYGYALLPGEVHDVQRLVVATNTESDIKVSPGDSQHGYYRYSVDEWAHYDHGEFTAANALLAEINQQFKSLHSKSDDDSMMDEFETAHGEVLIESIMQGLEAAKATGAFGSHDPFLAVWVSDSGEKIILESVQRLNSAAVAAEFIREFGT